MAPITETDVAADVPRLQSGKQRAQKKMPVRRDVIAVAEVADTLEYAPVEKAAVEPWYTEGVLGKPESFVALMVSRDEQLASSLGVFLEHDRPRDDHVDGRIIGKDKTNLM